MNLDMVSELTKDVRLVAVRDKGVLDLERAIFRVENTTQVGDLILLPGVTRGRDFVPSYNASFWLPNMEIVAGEYIRVYTRAGLNGRGAGRMGDRDVMFTNFYWARPTPIWTGPNDRLVLIRVKHWQAYPIDSEDE